MQYQPHPTPDNADEACLARLLRNHPQEEPVPGELRERIRAGLLRQAQAGRALLPPPAHGKRPVMKYIKIFLPAAAALLALAIFLGRSLSGPPAPVWADVVQNLEKIVSQKYLLLSTLRAPDGEIKLRGASRLYFRYPGCMRHDINQDPLGEDYQVFKTDEFDSLTGVVFSSLLKPDRIIHTVIEVRKKSGSRMITHYQDSGEPWPGKEDGGLYFDLRLLARASVRGIGSRMIGGIRAEGFACSVTDLPGNLFRGYENAPGRLWVSSRTALPVEAEFEIPVDEGVVTERFVDIVWNEPLPDELFLVDSHREYIKETFEFTEARRMFRNRCPRPGLDFRLLSTDGRLLASAGDVLAIESGTQIIDPPSSSLRLNIRLTDEARQRVKQYGNYPLQLMLDGRKLGANRVSGYNRHLLNIEIEQMNISLEEFEKTCLIPGPSGGASDQRPLLK